MGAGRAHRLFWNAAMTRQQEIAQADRYIARARKNIAAQRLRIREGSPEHAATAETLLELLTAMLENVERNRSKLVAHTSRSVE